MKEKRHIYLDNAATTPLSPNVKEYIISILDIYGNPSSIHSVGSTAKQLVLESKTIVENFIHKNKKRNGSVIFTSSGSASNTLAIRGLENDNDSVYSFLYSPIAHKSMIKACESCTFSQSLKVDNTGRINVVDLYDKLKSIHNDLLKPVVCIDGANSEIGIIQNISEIAKTVHEFNGILIVDGTGLIPYSPIYVDKLNIDILTFSAHKLGTLKGVGVLYKKNNIKLQPLIYGSQENGLFAGTENVIGISALGKAIEDYNYDVIDSSVRDKLLDRILSEIPDCYLIGSKTFRLPYNLCLCFKDITGESLEVMMDLDGVQISTGSACNSGDLVPSAVLKAIGIPDDDINCCVRLSMSGKETDEDIDYIIDVLKSNVNRLRFLE